MCHMVWIAINGLTSFSRFRNQFQGIPNDSMLYTITQYTMYNSPLACKIFNNDESHDADYILSQEPVPGNPEPAKWVENVGIY